MVQRAILHGALAGCWEQAATIAVLLRPTTTTERCGILCRFNPLQNHLQECYSKFFCSLFRRATPRGRIVRCGLSEQRNFISRSASVQSEPMDNTSLKQEADLRSTALVRIRPAEFFALVLAQQVSSQPICSTARYLHILGTAPRRGALHIFLMSSGCSFL